MKLLSLLPVLALAACTTPVERSGLLTSYEGLTPREALRAKIERRRDNVGLAGVQRVAVAPAEVAKGSGWLNEAERKALAREVDAQLCFELSERYEIVSSPDQADARVRAFVTRVRPTGRAGSAVSAASSFFIPGPIGVRVPGGLGGLAAEAEMLDTSGRQLAALTWNRRATVIGTDNPSLSRIGDALQMAEPFADVAAKAMTAKGRKSRKIGKPDPCAEYGPRIRPEGFLTKLATGLYVPKMSAARPEKDAPPKAD